MKLSKIFMLMVTVTFVSLFYIQLQVQIYDLGYQGERRKVEAQKLADSNGYLTSNIMQLKSVNHLGVKLLGDNSTRMQFLDNKHIVKLVAPQQVLGENSFLVAQTHKLDKRSRLLAGVFSLKSQAEAEPLR